MKICTRCKELKGIAEYNKAASKEDGFDHKCRSCAREMNRIRYQDKKEAIKQQVREWRQNNKEKKREIDRLYSIKNREVILKNRREWKKSTGYYKKQHQIVMSDPILKFAANIRSLVVASFSRGSRKFRKESRTVEILQCSLDFFLQHIQEKFTEGMTLENHGEWHLDHITPLATAVTQEDVIRLNHYTNFQPLWAKDNLSKGKKII
jgi:hypothetical protein